MFLLFKLFLGLNALFVILGFSGYGQPQDMEASSFYYSGAGHLFYLD